MVARGIVWSVLSVTILVPGLGLDAAAQEFGNTVTKRGVVEDNLFAAGEHVSVNAEVAGDVVAFGREVSVDESVKGDVLAAGRDVIVEASVDGDVRVAGADVDQRGSVGGDLMAAGRNVKLNANSRIGGRAWLAGAHIEIDGSIAKELDAAGRRIEISGEIGGDATLHGSDIDIGPTAVIKGNLMYRGPNEAEIHPDAQILGDVTFISSDMTERMTGTAHSLTGGSSIVILLGLMVLGAVQVLLLPTVTLGAARRVSDKPRRVLGMLGLGLGLLIATPLAIVLLMITVIGIPLAIVFLAILVVALLTGFLVSAVALGQQAMHLLKRTSDATPGGRILLVVIGLVALALIGFIPLLGTLITIAALAFGLGALITEVRGFGRGSAPA